MPWLFKEVEAHNYETKYDKQNRGKKLKKPDIS